MPPSSCSNKRPGISSPKEFLFMNFSCSANLSCVASTTTDGNGMWAMDLPGAVPLKPKSFNSEIIHSRLERRKKRGGGGGGEIRKTREKGANFLCDASVAASYPTPSLPLPRSYPPPPRVNLSVSAMGWHGLWMDWGQRSPSLVVVVDSTRADEEEK